MIDLHMTHSRHISCIRGFLKNRKQFKSFYVYINKIIIISDKYNFYLRKKIQAGPPPPGESNSMNSSPGLGSKGIFKYSTTSIKTITYNLRLKGIKTITYALSNDRNEI